MGTGSADAHLCFFVELETHDEAARKRFCVGVRRRPFQRTTRLADNEVDLAAGRPVQSKIVLHNKSARRCSLQCSASDPDQQEI